jgi:hypothetical protein
MFTKLTPQRIQHDSGYIVQTGSRDSLQYINGEVLAEVRSDFGPITTIYSKSLVLIKNENKIPPSIDDQKLILKRITDALDFLGEEYELWKELVVPKGTTVYQGFAAPQGGLLGGGSQVYIPKVNSTWLVNP